MPFVGKLTLEDIDHSNTFSLWLAVFEHTCVCFKQWGIFPVWEIRGFPILLSRSGKNCQNLSRSGNKMINFYMPQHISRRIKTNQLIAKTISLAKS